MISSWTGAASLFDDMEYYIEHGRNAYLHGLEGSKRDADLIVDGSLTLDKIIEVICEKVMAVRNAL